MKQMLILLQILSISLLICSCVQAQQPNEITENHAANDNKIRQSLSIKFQRAKPTRMNWDPYFNFPLQFSSENITIPMGFSLTESKTWINQNFYSKIKGAPFKCSESRSCQSKETLDQSHQAQEDWNRLVQEQVSFGGLTLPNLDVFMENHTHGGYQSNPEVYGGSLGLSFERSNPEAPTIYKTLKSEDLIEEAIVSVSLKDSYEGELILGGYPSSKTKADFKFVPLVGKSTVSIKGVGYRYPEGQNQAIFDIETSGIVLSTRMYMEIHDIIGDQGLGIQYPLPQGVPQIHPDGSRAVKCKAMDVLNDLIVEFEGFTLQIPASAYIIRAKGFYYDNEEMSSEEGCFVAIQEHGNSQTVIFGRPFFKAYDIVFDSETNSVGFSPRHTTGSPLRNFTPYIIITMSLAGFILLGFLLSGGRKDFTKLEVEFNEFGRGLHRNSPPSSKVGKGFAKLIMIFNEVGRRLHRISIPSSENLSDQVQIGEQVQILPYQEESQNSPSVQSDEKGLEN